MTGILTGVTAFVFLTAFECRKCRSFKKGIPRKNYWFIAGTVMLFISYITAAEGMPADSSIRFASGLLIMTAGMAAYAYVLFSVQGTATYINDSIGGETGSAGIYGRMRHPGIWCFGAVSFGYWLAFPRGLASAVLCTALNFIYTLLQDRYFFPVYLKGYREYRENTPFMFPFKGNEKKS
ncbi:MAG: hypothetical protein Q4C14_00415 [Bacillota bacterium]|nr:hypothetical protein [Bacillota bacterium]